MKKVFGVVVSMSLMLGALPAGADVSKAELLDKCKAIGARVKNERKLMDGYLAESKSLRCEREARHEFWTDVSKIEDKYRKEIGNIVAKKQSIFKTIVEAVKAKN